MPELPEVETVRLGLEKYLVGKKITGVEVRLPKIIKEGDVRDLVGGKVAKVRRFGKVLVLDLDSGLSVVAHIKLTGQFVYVGAGRPKNTQLSPKLVGQLPNKWSHVIFRLDRGTLFYNDVRQFGWIRIVKTRDVEKLPFIHELGPEPIRLASARSGQASLTLEHFRKILNGKKTAIKSLLMDQKKIGGVGNIYANDALFLAKIDPRKPAGKLSSDEAVKLYRAILEVLKRGLKYGGATEINFVNVLGQPGGYQEHFLAYGQEGKPCSVCGTTIKKIRIGGRGTYFCPACQR